MAFVAVFEVRVGGERGVLVGDRDEAAGFVPIHLTVRGYQVRVVPIVVTHTEEDFIGPEGEPVEFDVEYLDLLRAEVTIETDATTLNGADTQVLFGNPRRAALDAFRRVLSAPFRKYRARCQAAVARVSEASG